MLPAALLADLERRHSRPERAYHAWSHPQTLLALLAEVRDQLNDPLAVECAIVLHDAVYEPTRGDNEARSAELAREVLTGVVPPETLTRAVRMIEATERHSAADELPSDEANDVRIFLDLDLSILGAPEAAFDAYEAGIRHEYAHVPEPTYRQARAAVLEGFQGREHLYMSTWGRARFEAKARRNLARSLAKLQKG